MGIISILDSRIELTHVDTTVFTNKGKSFVGPWEFNEEIEAVVREELSRSPYTIVSIKYNRGDLISKAYLSKDLMVMSYQDYSLESIKSDLARIARENSLDAIILVSSWFNKEGHTNAMLSGLGLYNRAILWSESTELYFFMMTKILDGKTIKILAMRPTGVFQKVDNSYWVEDASKLSEEVKNFMESTAREHIKKSIPLALSRAGLTECKKGDEDCTPPE